MSELVSSFDLGLCSFSTYSEKPAGLNSLFEVTQVHGREIEPFSSENLQLVQADGISLYFDDPALNRFESIRLCIRTADCLSIAIVGKRGVINLHAGWRGLAQGILFNPAVEAIEPQTFCLSAAIAAKNYEVSPDFPSNFKDYQESFKTIDGKLTFSLHKTANAMIRSRYAKANILSDELDTFSDKRLNSFRENATEKRNWNILSLST